MRNIYFMFPLFLMLAIQYSYAADQKRDLQNQLDLAIKGKDPKKAVECINAGVCVDDHVLYDASKQCLIDVVNAAITSGINPNKTFKYDENTKTWLEEKDHKSTPLLVICKSIYGNTSTFVDMTYSHRALLHSAHEGIFELIQHGANPNLSDTQGNTPLHCICGSKDGRPEITQKIIQVLLKNGANPFITNKEGKTPRECVHLNPQDPIFHTLQVSEKKLAGHIKRCTRRALRGTTQPPKRKVKKGKPSTCSTHLLEKPLP